MSLWEHSHKWKLVDIQKCVRNQFVGTQKISTDDASIFLYSCKCGEHKTVVLDGVWNILAADRPKEPKAEKS